MAREYYAPLCVLLLCVVIGCLPVWFWLKQLRGPEEHATIRKVKVLYASFDFVHNAIARKEPVVIKNSVVSRWRATRLWNPAYLQRKIGTISGVYENENRWFGPYYDREKPLSSFSHRVNPYRTNVVMKAREFFTRIQHPQVGRYHYFTGDIGQLGEWAMEDISPVDSLLSPNPRHSSINVWMGQPNVVAHCHYDGYHNFYAQLYGTKKFTMFPPNSWPGLYPYPFLHPSHAQAQVNLSDDADVALFPLTRRVEAYQVVLQPGDLLYMPPLWFHHVESLSVSISVNVWTDSDQTPVMEKVFALQLPTSEVQWHSDHLKAIAGSVVMSRAVDSVCHLRDCPLPNNDHFADYKTEPTPQTRRGYLVHRLWSARYRRLMERGEQANSFTKDGQRTSLLCEKGPLPESVYRFFFRRMTEELEETSIKHYLQTIPQLVALLPEDTWELWFGNYLEYVAASTVRLEHVGLFLRHFESCINNFW